MSKSNAGFRISVHRRQYPDVAVTQAVLNKHRSTRYRLTLLQRKRPENSLLQPVSLIRCGNCTVPVNNTLRAPSDRVSRSLRCQSSALSTDHSKCLSSDPTCLISSACRGAVSGLAASIHAVKRKGSMSVRIHPNRTHDKVSKLLLTD